MIDKNDYINKEEKIYNEDKNKFLDLLKETREAILDESLSKEVRNKHINAFFSYTYQYIREFDKPFDREKALLVYQECETVWNLLSRFFKTEWIRPDELAVDINCNSLSQFCIIVAKLTNLHEGYFAFSSSFTTHEAYTQSNHLIHITTLPDGRGLIQFHL